MEPASITKVMTAYSVFKAIAEKRTNLNAQEIGDDREVEQVRRHEHGGTARLRLQQFERAVDRRPTPGELHDVKASTGVAGRHRNGSEI